MLGYALRVNPTYNDLIAVTKRFGIHDYLAAPVTQESLLARMNEKLNRDRSRRRDETDTAAEEKQ